MLFCLSERFPINTSNDLIVYNKVYWSRIDLILKVSFVIHIHLFYDIPTLFLYVRNGISTCRKMVEEKMAKRYTMRKCMDVVGWVEIPHYLSILWRNVEELFPYVYWRHLSKFLKSWSERKVFFYVMGLRKRTKAEERPPDGDGR